MPDDCELYRHFDRDGGLLYVGVSSSTILRLRQHKNSSSWYEQIVRIEIERFASRAEARNAEIQAIKNEKPAHNRWTDVKRGPGARRSDIEDQRQALIAQAKAQNIRISKVWCLSVLKMALERASNGVQYPYQ